ncbi:hypothetical protein [Actinomadura decatromicini]|uniref:Uncharacterized protein n=1 Tax=Actinomadura decatromicini TaxID=2604572 RepID=A0A5D3F9I3_9ACTN|nr:hypothetical protein [Actinomadura decatromicini]TYK44496.1 hypothetical protein FXF68_34060 [Actinomadura decatromicini]
MTLTIPAPVPSSGRDRRSCGDAGAAVRQHWGTPIAFATLDPAGLLSPSASAIEAEGPPVESVPPDEFVTDPDALAAQFHASFDALAAAHGPGLTPPVGRIDVAVRIWRHGHAAPAAAHPADLVGWWVLDASPAPAPAESAHAESGALAFADPRHGAEAPALPGRPWGRRLLVRPVPGAHVAVPGWLAASVVPVARGQHVLVAVASTVR